MTKTSNLSTLCRDFDLDAASAVGNVADTDLIQLKHLSTYLSDVSIPNPPLNGQTLEWDGTNWVAANPASTPATATRQDFVATANQTNFPVTYDAGSATDVFLNGVKLYKDDFTATSGTELVLIEAAAAGDIVQFIAGYYPGGGVYATTNHAHTEYEPLIEPKNTGFNLATGTTTGTVATGDHVHEAYALVEHGHDYAATNHTHSDYSDLGVIIVNDNVTDGQTTFNVQHDAGKLEVYFNGVRLFPDDDYTSDASAGTVTLREGGLLGDKFSATGFYALAPAAGSGGAGGGDGGVTVVSFRGQYATTGQPHYWENPTRFSRDYGNIVSSNSSGTVFLEGTEAQLGLYGYVPETGEYNVIRTLNGTIAPGAQYSSSLAGNMSRIAIGQPAADIPSSDAGVVEIMDVSADGSYVSTGSVPHPYDFTPYSTQRFGTSTSLNGDGTMIAIGQYRHGASTTPVNGMVWIYRLENSIWVMKTDIYSQLQASGEALNFAYWPGSVSLSGAGGRLAVGHTGATKEGTNPSAVEIFDGGEFEYSINNGDGTKTLYYKKMDAEGYLTKLSLSAAPDPVAGEFYYRPVAYIPAPINAQFGYATALSGDGSVLVVGSQATDSNMGMVYIYDLAEDGTVTERQAFRDTEIDTLGYGSFGSRVSISDDGAVLFVGAMKVRQPNPNIFGSNSVRSGDGAVYSYGIPS